MSISMQQLSNFVNPVFVETGTYTGLTIQKALDAGFKEIHSIEISEQLHSNSRAMYRDLPSVHTYCGNSADVLTQILPLITEPATFWLDAHNFEFCPDKVSGNPFPLMDEIRCLSTKREIVHTVLVDDLPCFRTFHYDLDAVRSALLKINSRFRFEILENSSGRQQIFAATDIQ